MLTIHKASAGSGKTFALTRDYIKLLLSTKDEETGQFSLNRTGVNRHRSILAITFTNKATEEMKRRIVHELAVLGGCEPGWNRPSAYNDLTSELNCSADDLRNTAATALKELLLDFNNFHVSTIDSFFQTVLRAFAREAELTGNYEIELDRKLMINQSVAQLLTSLRDNNLKPATKSELENWLLRKVLDNLRRGNSYNIFNRSTGMFNDLVDFINSITDETFQDHRSEILEYLSDFTRIGKFADRAWELALNAKTELKDLAHEITDYIRSVGFEPTDVIKHNPYKAITKWFEISEQEFRKYKQNSSSNTSMAKLICSDIYYSAKKGPDKGKFIFRDNKLDEMICRFGSLAQTVKTRVDFYYALRRNSIDIGLLRHIDVILQQSLTGENMLLLSDTGTILEAILGDSSAPFVFERIGAWLKHFLIDEFQDTSAQQWRILLPLIENALSTGDNSLIIGDEKQCIYRFRNSDPTLLQSGVSSYFGSRVSIEERGSRPDENTNWRSSVEIVEFNNMLFDRISQNLGYSQIYTNVRQQVSDAHRNHHGYVEVTNYIKAQKEKSSVRVKRQSLSNMMDHISRQIKAGYAPSRIVILIRNNREGQEIMNFILRAPDVNPQWPALRVVSDDSFELGYSPVVRMITSILRVIASPVAPEGSSRRISKLHYARLMEDLELKTNEGISRSEALAEVIGNECRGAYDNNDITIGSEVENIAGGMTCMNLISLTERIVQLLVSPAVRERENVYISAFADAVAEYQQHFHNDIQSFMSWWDTTGSRRKVNIPPDENAIRLITIHKAKGLEFSCVHIPLTSWTFFKEQSMQWFSMTGIPEFDPDIVPPYFPLNVDKKLVGTFLENEFIDIKRKSILDELNVTYVAFTRAVDELIVGCFSSGNNSDNSYPADKIICETLNIQNGGTFTMGQPTTATPEKSVRPTAADPQGIDVMPAYRGWERTDLWDNTRLDTSDSISEQRINGITFHSIMAQIHSMKDIERVCRNLAATGALDRDDAENLRNNICKMIAEGGVERWFEGFDRILCEPEIVMNDNECRRPDRVVWLSDGSVEVIDYKTGERDDKRYSHQVSLYMKLLQQAGCTTVRGYVWYVNLNKIIKVKS